jgi:L-arabinose isomerase
MTDKKVPAFHRRVNEAMREARGVVVGGHQIPEANARMNSWMRQQAAKRSWETTPDGRLTRIEGEEV